MNKYVNIKIEGEGNIGVIDLGKVEAQAVGIENTIKRTLEPKLIKALESHFDCPVKIIMTEIKSVTGYIRARVFVVVESMDEDRNETIELEETWIY